MCYYLCVLLFIIIYVLLQCVLVIKALHQILLALHFTGTSLDCASWLSCVWWGHEINYGQWVVLRSGVSHFWSRVVNCQCKIIKSLSQLLKEWWLMFTMVTAPSALVPECLKRAAPLCFSMVDMQCEYGINLWFYGLKILRLFVPQYNIACPGWYTLFFSRSQRMFPWGL